MMVCDDCISYFDEFLDCDIEEVNSNPDLYGYLCVNCISNLQVETKKEIDRLLRLDNDSPALLKTVDELQKKAHTLTYVQKEEEK